MSDETTELQGILDEFEHECFMLRVEASETRARDDVVRKSYERIRDEFTGRIAATLGSDRIAELEQLIRDIMAGNPRCTVRSCADCDHDEDDGCGVYRRICELGLIGGSAR